jgi:hypothetical protein
MHMNREVMIGYTSKGKKTGKELKVCNMYGGKKEEF